MKAIWMAVAVALSLSTVACGGTTGICKKICEKQADCEEGDVMYKADVDDCKEACDDAEEEDECKSEGKKFAKCVNKNFECDTLVPEDCEDQAKDVVECAE